MIDVSCILINYNSSEYTKSCVNSILTRTNPKLSIEIIIIDNASEKEDANLLQKELDVINDRRVKFYKSNINTGFGAGNMLGFHYASPSKYTAFINNDCEIESDVLSQLFALMNQNESIGVCSPQMYDTERKFTPTIGTFPSITKEVFGRSFLEKMFPKKHLKKHVRYTNPTKVDLVIGSFMFFRTEDFCKIGGFDTNLFLYFEEADICYRLTKINKSVYLFPSISYVHHISKSTGSNKSLLIQKEFYISLLYIIRKNNGYFSYHVLLNFFRLKFLFKSVFKPSKFSLFKLFIFGLPLSSSLKQKQIIK